MKDVYLIGYTSIALGADPALGGTDAFIMQFDGDTGATLWIRQFGTAGNDRAFGIAFFENRVGIQYMSWERPSVRWMERRIRGGMTPSSSGTTSSESDCNGEEPLSPFGPIIEEVSKGPHGFRGPLFIQIGIVCSLHFRLIG